MKQPNRNNIMWLILGFMLMLLSHSVLAGPKIEHWTSSNGLKVYYVAAPQLPMLDVQLVFSAGSANDGEKLGLAKLVSYNLDEGAAGLNADQLAEAFDAVGASYSASSARDMAWISLRSLTLERELEAALSTWLKIVGQPDFPEKSLARLKNQMLVGLKAEQQSPSKIASKAFYKALYGDHPYGKPANGTKETLTAMTRDDLIAYFKQYYVVENGLLAMVGAIDRKQAEALAERISKTLVKGKKAAAIPAVKSIEKADTVHIPYPSEQAHIYIGQIGNKRGDPDYYTLYTGNHVFGGSGFNSRLVKQIRDKRGLSYSVYSYFLPMEEYGPFMLGMQTKVEQAEEAQKVANDELKKFVAEGPTEEELNRSKKDIMGGFPLRTASNADIISYLATIGFYDLPLDYLDTFTGKIETLTKTDIVDAFKRRIQADKLITIVVGGDEKATP